MSARPNFTAWFVLQGTIAAMREPAFRDARNDATLALYDALAAASAKTSALCNLIHRLPWRWQYRIGGLVTHPGRLRHYYLRKNAIAAQARELLRRGDIGQVIILGAGLDVLALKLASEFRDVRCIEIDIPASQTFKQAALAQAHIAIPANLDFIGGDLREPLAGIVGASRLYAPQSKTLWIAEGLFMFIPEDGVVRLFTSMKSLCAAGSQVIFTSLPVKHQESLLGRLLQPIFLYKEDSRIFWAMPRADMPDFLHRLGYEIEHHTDYHELHKNHISQKSNINKDVGEDIHRARMLNP
jgi:methyltransferase (TIGR00027 family)